MKCKIHPGFMSAGKIEESGFVRLEVCIVDGKIKGGAWNEEDGGVG